LTAAREAEPKRPEAYFNQALLVMGMSPERGPSRACTAQTRALFEQGRKRSDDAELRE